MPGFGGMGDGLSARGPQSSYGGYGGGGGSGGGGLPARFSTSQAQGYGQSGEQVYTKCKAADCFNQQSNNCLNSYSFILVMVFLPFALVLLEIARQELSLVNRWLRARQCQQWLQC